MDHNTRCTPLPRSCHHGRALEERNLRQLSVTNSDDRRSVILDQLADFVLAEGLSAASLRPLAHAADTSDRMLLYYFKDKAEIISATLERVSDRLVAILNEATHEELLSFDDLRAHLQDIVLNDSFWPFMALWLEVVALAARNNPLYREIGERLGRGFLTWIESQLVYQNPEQHRGEAARLFAMIEGFVLLKGIGMRDVCEDGR